MTATAETSTIRYCGCCGRTLAEHDDRKARLLAVVLLILPSGAALFGLHRIYVGRASGWAMLVGFHVSLMVLAGSFGAGGGGAGVIGLLGLGAVVITQVVDLVRLAAGGLRPPEGWRD
ncbi:MAG: hypothetical protein AAGD18_14315 [Actinomycetota bacterium]